MAARLSRLARRLAAAGLALGLAACADGFAPAASSLTWSHFMAAEDLRYICDEDAADRYRMIFHDRAPARLRLFEILEDRAAGGAAVRGRTLSPDDMAQTTAGDAYSDWRGVFASYRLSPLQFALLVRRLDDAGAFDPPPFGGARPPNAARLLVGGCRDGGWFFNVFEDPRTAGELIGWGT